MVLRRFQAIRDANGLPKLRIYDLRHTHASLLIHEGVHPKKMAERLGHSSIKLTMDTYGHLFEGSDHDGAPTDQPGRTLVEPRQKLVLTKLLTKT